MTGFAAADITIGNGTVSNFLGSDASYPFDREAEPLDRHLSAAKR